MGDRFGFPFGTGASSRVAAYAAGLQAAGASVKVLCVEPSEDADDAVNLVTKGRHDGVAFEYTYGQTVRPEARGRRAWLKFTKWPRFFLAGCGWGRGRGGLDAVLVYSLSLRWILAARVLCRLTGAVLLHEDCELPFYWNAGRPATTVRRWLHYNVAFRAIDGCLVISTYLEELCARHLRGRGQTLLVPVLVDASGPLPDVTVSDDVTFCGSLDHPEVLSLLEIFAMVAGQYPDANVRLVGSAKRESSLLALERRAAELGIGKRVAFAGHVNRDALPAVLCAARVLVLPRPSGAFSQAGLPTKVAEYLASGRPVVVSANGDLPRYLEDGRDAYLVAPDDQAAFAARLAHVLGHPEEATAVGTRGRVTAARSFDPAKHGARILEFIGELKGRKAVGEGEVSA